MTLHVEEHGNGETLLLHQGLGQASWAWRYQVPAFAQRFRTIVFDTRGTGRSPTPDDSYTIDDLAEDAAAILDGRVAHVVGFSMGGYVALTLALAHPHLIRSLILCGTGAGGLDRVPRPDHVREAFEKARTLQPEEQRRATLPLTVSPGWPQANAERFEEIIAASLEHPTPLATIDAHTAACYGYYDEHHDVERMDGAGFATAEIAWGKAWTAAAWGLASGALAERIGADPSFAAAVSVATAGRFTPRQGALPLPEGGAVGASGGSSQQDEDVVRAAIG